MKIQSVWLFTLAVAIVCSGQQKAAPKKSPVTPTAAPTLGFNKIKDVPPIMDGDAFREETELKKKLPDNPYVEDTRAVHETALMQEFLEGFRESKECAGITFYLKKDTVPDYYIQITVNNHDNGQEQEWIWMLLDTKRKTFGGLGNQSSAKLTARDICLTAWENLDPNHFKKPGGRIE